MIQSIINNNKFRYALERHLKKYEILFPKEPVIGNIRGEPIYSRKNVKQVIFCVWEKEEYEKEVKEEGCLIIIIIFFKKNKYIATYNRNLVKRRTPNKSKIKREKGPHEDKLS